jgi:exopolysaccharide biosynthesis polyprenyl glycosylphosphotransferase
MQHDLEYTATMASQGLYVLQDEVLMIEEKGRGVGLSVAKVADGIQESSRDPLRRIKQRKMLLHLGLRLGDGVLLVALLELVPVLIPYLHLGMRVPMYNLGTSYTKLAWGSLALILWIVATTITNAYKTLNASSRFRSALNVIVTLTLVLTFGMVVTALFFTEDMNFYVKIELFLFTIATPTLAGWRVLFAEIMCSPRFRPKAVILGTTIAGKTIAKRPYATILGYISEDMDSGMQLHEDGIAVLGGMSALHRLGQSGMVEMIIIAIDYHVYPKLFRQVIEIAQLGVSVVPMPIAYENASGKIPVEHIGDQWYLSLPLEIVVSPLYLFWRKVLDVSCGLIGTALLLLFLPIVALLIRLDSRGPIFYSQERLGIKGKPFRIYKFRSMHVDAEQTGQAQWAQENDMRVTRMGRFMRATHLDELPQVLNILRGEMSLIGPRPEREELAVELEKIIPFFRWRLAVKPGLTGWAQVKHHYAGSENDTLIKLQYDLYYIKHQSFMLDIVIILMTFAEVFLHRGT